MKAHHKDYIAYFVQLKVEHLSRIPEFFAADARFKDPFNDVIGLKRIQRIFEHMFETTMNPQFVVRHAAQTESTEEDVLLLVWDFSFKTKRGKAFSWQGSSKVMFNEAGLAIEHIDYWDPAESIYESLPLIGSAARFMKSKLASG